MHVGGWSVTRLSGVDDDDRAALATELEGSGKARRRRSYDGDIAVALDGPGSVFAHPSDDTTPTLPSQ